MSHDIDRAAGRTLLRALDAAGVPHGRATWESDDERTRLRLPIRAESLLTASAAVHSALACITDVYEREAVEDLLVGSVALEMVS